MLDMQLTDGLLVWVIEDNDGPVLILDSEKDKFKVFIADIDGNTSEEKLHEKLSEALKDYVARLEKLE